MLEDRYPEGFFVYLYGFLEPCLYVLDLLRFLFVRRVIVAFCILSLRILDCGLFLCYDRLTFRSRGTADIVVQVKDENRGV